MDPPSNKWLRGGYAARLRTRFARTCTIETIVDFGHAPVFPDADAFPCIVTMRKTPPPEKHAVRVTQYPREELGKDLLASYVDEHAFSLSQEDLSNDGWTLEPPAARALLAKLRQNGVRLAEYAGTKPYRGVLTGCNEAFLVDRATKERLCREHPRSAEVLRKYLRGQDVDRWAPEWAGLWMIYAPWDFDIGSFPAIGKHLMEHRDALAARPEVKQDRFPWYAMSRYASDYVALFDTPKIVYQEIQFHPSYAMDREGLLLNNKAFLLSVDDPWLVAVLNSPAMWWHNWRFLVHLKDEALSPAGEKMVDVPIPRPTEAQRERAAADVARIVQLTRASRDSVRAVLDLLRMEYEVETPGQALEDFAALDSDAFVLEVRKRRPPAAQQKGKPRGRKPLSAPALRALRELHEMEATPIREVRASIATLERQIADQVHSAFGLTAQEPQTAALVKEPLAAVRAALRTYALRVLAHEQADDADGGELLGPLVEWQSRAPKAAKLAAPATPPAGAGGTNATT